jgi:hypothetical protein
VPVFSLLSKNTVVPGSAAAGWMERPKLLLLPAATHAMTMSVTSMLMNWPALLTAAVAAPELRSLTGTVAAVTVASLQALPRVCTSTEPAVPTRLTYNTRLALSRFDGVASTGKDARSKRSKAVAPPPVFRVAVVP